ncbi:MAG: energy transducer TonB [Prevotella sp.]|nr:energy transducer TonB [Candidatus Equicola stercoris]
METKKTPKANLDNYRLTFFLVGVVVALLVLYIALEWGGASSGNEALQRNIRQEMTQELDMIPLLKEDPIITAPKPQQEVKKIEDINIVDNTRQESVNMETPEVADNQSSVQELLPEDKLHNDPISQVEMTEQQKDSVFRIVEELPSYPGGMVEFMKWLTANLKYPISAQRQNIQGTCKVSFIINKDGSVSNIKVIKHVSKLCDAEALRVIKSMPAWQPGKYKGEPVRTKIMIPIVFKL